MGYAQVILQSGLAGQGKLTLRATSEGLAAGEVMIDVMAVPVPGGADCRADAGHFALENFSHYERASRSQSAAWRQ